MGLEAATDSDFTAMNLSICRKVHLKDKVDCDSLNPYLSWGCSAGRCPNCPVTPTKRNACPFVRCLTLHRYLNSYLIYIDLSSVK